jgi:imidazolonepropionase-like amidohydrolase
VCTGVTAVFDVGGYAWSYGLRERAESDAQAPHVAAAGPLLSTVDHWINLPDEKQIVYIGTDSAARAQVRANLARGADAIKVWYVVRPNADTAALKLVVRAAADETHRLGARLIVHATALWEAKDALRAGADLLVHGVMSEPVDNEFIELARQRNAIYTPTLTVGDGYRQVRVRHFEPHYPTACVDSTTLAHARATDTIPGGTPGVTDRRLEIGIANLGVVFRAGIPIAMGTDAGNPLTLHGPSVYWEMESMQQSGMRPMDVIVASTRNGARAMGRQRDLGTIEPGKIADLIVLDADPAADIKNVQELRYVMRSGALTTPRLVGPR